MRQYGELIASRWPGNADRGGEALYIEDTLVNDFSSSRGILALLAPQQVAASALDLDHLVADRRWLALVEQLYRLL